MQRTSNYGLCQYEGSDKTSYLVNYNDDMLKIDTAIKSATDGASAAQTKADTADGKADTNAGNISTLNTQINGEGGIAADVGTLQGSVQTITSLIGNGTPTTTDQTIIGAINELNSKEGNLASLTTTEKSSLVGAINELNLTKLDVSAITNRYVLKEQGYVSATADGVKTISQLLDEARAALTTLISGLDTKYQLEVTQLYVPGYGSFHTDGASFYIGGDTSTSLIDFVQITSEASDFHIRDIVCATSGSIFRQIDLVSSNITDKSIDVPASDSVVISFVIYEKL